MSAEEKRNDKIKKPVFSCEVLFIFPPFKEVIVSGLHLVFVLSIEAAKNGR